MFWARRSTWFQGFPKDLFQGSSLQGYGSFHSKLSGLGSHSSDQLEKWCDARKGHDSTAPWRLPPLVKRCQTWSTENSMMYTYLIIFILSQHRWFLYFFSVVAFWDTGILICDLKRSGISFVTFYVTLFNVSEVGEWVWCQLTAYDCIVLGCSSDADYCGCCTSY